MFESLVDALDGLATKCKAQMKKKFWEIRTIVKSKLIEVFSALNQRRYQNESVLEIEDGGIKEGEQDGTTQFLHKQNNKFTDFHDHLEKNSNILPCFNFNSAK